MEGLEFRKLDKSPGCLCILHPPPPPPPNFKHHLPLFKDVINMRYLSVNPCLKGLCEDTGCPTEHDSWWIVFNVFFHDTELDVKDFLQFIFFLNLFLKYILLWNPFYYNMTAMKYFLLFSLVSNNLTDYGRRHFKLFTNCHVSWDTL